MKYKDVLQRIPKEGFLRLTLPEIALPGDKRIALIRKGNELFNRGEYELAKKIFLSTNYADGLVRLGDRLIKDKKPLEAFRMYWLARHEKKRELFIRKMSSIIKHWLHEER